MNFKKFISGVSAFAIAASAFAGMAVTASAKTGSFDVEPTATKIHAGNPTTNYYDATATSWTVTQSSISGGNFQDGLSQYGGSYLMISKFDASEYKSETIVSATLSFDAQCTVAGKNSEIRIAQIATDWDAATATWDSVRDPGLSASQKFSAGSVNTTKVNKTFDVKDILAADEDGVLGFAIYTYTGREQEISNYKLTIETTDATLYDVSFTGLPTGAKVTVGDEDAASGISLANGEYAYTATAVGYKKLTGSFTVNGAAVEVPVSMTAVAAGSAYSVPTDAVSSTKFADAYTDSASGQIAGYDTYGDGSTFYATADFIINEGGKANLWFGVNSSSNMGSAGTGTSVDFSEAEIRYYTNSAGTAVEGTIEADTWYRVTVSSDLANTLGGDFTNLDPKLHFDVVKLADNSVVASFDTGYRNSNKGIRYIKVSANNQNTVNNVYTYFVEDPAADFKVDMGEGRLADGDNNDVATWYIATVTNDGNAEGSFDTMTLYKDGTASAPQTFSTAITISANADAYIGVIVNGLDTTANTITATVE